ncbi:bifunctional protein FolD 2 [Panicum miliaceum]|uniref:Bifunctional protein FolD 2 n=1 Tax=Panicum miliaceum TaxID=4540 RepID=A0A3L6RDW1_PANMI|nr:bifunctional protein FolD 2 [Panicum miliaceum]
MAQIIDGKAIAGDIRREVAAEVAALSSAHNVVPGLAVVIVGSRKDSQTYVNMKRKACAEVGICSVDVDLPEDISELALVAEVHRLNADPAVHGTASHALLLLFPEVLFGQVQVLNRHPCAASLPKHINEEKILSEISIEKDVDGFHPLNIGKLAMKGREPLFIPCTPKYWFLSWSGVTVKGKRAVVVGRSNIVGLPVSLLLLKADATIKGDWIKPGAAVIDVGMNSVDDPTRKSGYRLVGDVDFTDVSKVAGYLTPVPGGDGPMTVAMLLKNTVDGAKRGIVE